MHHRNAGRRAGPFLFSLLALGAVPSASFADGPPQLTSFTVVGQSEDRVVEAGAPLRFRLGGSGKCPVEVQIQPVGGNTAASTQVFDAVLGGREVYATSYVLPPYGTAGRVPLTADFTITALPKAPCKGAAQAAIIHSTCKGTCSASPAGERPRIVLPSVRPTASTSPSPAKTTSAPPTPTTPPTPPVPPAPTSSGTSKAPAPPTPPSPPSIPGAKAATGNLSSMTVPGGSFAEDEAQKLQLKGTGGCTLDLHISNKSYGGSFDKTFNVNPVNLASSPPLYNGTHFDTLAEGSWHADATGKNGCAGTVQTDFKVTAKSTNASVKGQPTLTLDKQPKSGNAFSKSKDSNIWFKVTVPSSFKDVPYVSCCEVEYDYVNQYGGWEVLSPGPFGDPGLNPMANNNQASFRSVSYFSVPNEAATKWRMRVRGTKFKTAFEWSDWLEFQVDQK